MSEPKDLLLANEYLRRSRRRWKALALAACSVLVIAVLLGSAAVYTAQMRADQEMRRANAAVRRLAAVARARQASLAAQQAANPAQPK